jgi:hypothetical protein
MDEEFVQLEADLVAEVELIEHVDRLEDISLSAMSSSRA